MTEARKLADWIEEQSRRDDAGKLAKLVCCHIIRGNKLGDEIRTVTVPDDGAGEDWIASTAARIVEQGASEAVTLAAGIQRYAVLAYFGSEEKSRGRHVFTCAGQDEEDGAIGTEGPDEQGLVAQAMRHAEVFAQMGSRAVVVQMKDLREEISQLRKENAELRAERIKSFRIMEEVYSMAAQRHAEERRDLAKTKLIEDSAEKVGLLLPVAINHLAGKKVFPEAVADTLLLKSFVDSIKPDQLAALSAALSPEQLAVLMKLATSVSKPAAEKPAAPSTGNGVHP